MPEVNGNYEQQYQMNGYDLQQTGIQNQQSGYRQAPIRQKTLRDEFVTQHKKNGLVERLYNGIKNLTGLGMGSKKVKAIVAKAENGEISEDKAREAISKYRSSQANSAQVAGDAVSMAGGIAVFLATQKRLVEDGPVAYLRKKHGIIKEEEKNEATAFLDFFTKKEKGLRMSESQLAKAFKNPKGMYWRMALVGMLGAGCAKWLFGLFNRIGAKEFYVDKADFNGATDPYDKAAYSQVCKENKRERRRADGKNFLSGMINHVTIPLMGLVGGLVGVPLYFAINSLNRYFVGNHVDEDKSFSKYFENIKNNGFLGATLALGAGIPIAIKTHKMSVFDKYSRAAVKKLEHVTFAKNEFGGSSNYKELSDILFSDREIMELVNQDPSLRREGYNVFSSRRRAGDLDEEGLKVLAQALVDKNFFAAKFKQISNDGTALARVLKEDSRPTRTYEKAQEYIDSCFGKGEYKIDPKHYCLGVGTVAETYFAKNKEGKDVCIKVIKKGMSADKIKRDAEAFRQIIDKAINPKTGKPFTEAEKKIYKQNIDNLEQGVLKEIDLANEWEMAKNLANDTKYADVVKGLTISKDHNAYVMKRARGISLESLMNLNEAYAFKENLEKLERGEIVSGGIGAFAIAERMRGSELEAIIKDLNSSNDKNSRQVAIERIDNYIEKIKAKTPEFSNNIILEPEDIKNLISELQQVFVEQYSRVSEGAKFIHGDMHSANIMVDVNALKNMKKPNKLQELWTGLTGKVKRKNHGVFTVIDTGNVIKLSKEQSISLLNLTSYIEHGNYQKIAEYVMQGVEGDALGGYTKEQATKIISDQLKACFTDTKTPLETMTTDNLLKLTSNIMKKHGIVPNDTQLNLNKAIQSANNSYEALVKGLTDGRLADFSIGEVVQGLFTGRSKMASDESFKIQTKKLMEKAQQQENLRNMSAAERRSQKRMEGNLKPNQEEYHIYRLKQGLLKPRAEKPKGIIEQTTEQIGLAAEGIAESFIS